MLVILYHEKLLNDKYIINIKFIFEYLNNLRKDCKWK